MQGISSNQPFFAKICLENICEFSRLRMNSLRGRAGNFFARAGNFYGAQGIGREFRANLNPLAATHPMASKFIFGG